MENTVGGKAVTWGVMGVELLGVVYDLRWMIVLSVVLILADLWWGYSEAKKRLAEARAAGNMTLEDKFKWHKSRAVRRTANKFVDYVTYLLVGALFGVAITEPMEICGHVTSAAVGLGLGCGCEIASIVGHVAYVKMGAEISVVDGWRAFVRFLGRLIRVKSDEIGGAVEDLGRERRRRHEYGYDDGFDGETGRTELNEDNF